MEGWEEEGGGGVMTFVQNGLPFLGAFVDGEGHGVCFGGAAKEGSKEGDRGHRFQGRTFC